MPDILFWILIWWMLNYLWLLVWYAKERALFRKPRMDIITAIIIAVFAGFIPFLIVCFAIHMVIKKIRQRRG